MSPWAIVVAIATMVACSGAHDRTASSDALPTLVFVLAGQSNAQGFGTTAYNPTPGSNDQLYDMAGNVRALIDPIGEHGVLPNGSGAEHSGYSLAPRFVEALRALGVTNPILIVPAAFGGTSSTDWATSANSSPPNLGTCAGILRDRLRTVMKFRPSVIGGIITYQGESDAGRIGNWTAYQANWQAVYDAIAADATAFGWTYSKSIKYWHVILPVTATTQAPAPTQADWDAIRAAGAALVSANSTVMHSIQAPDTVVGLVHQDSNSDSTGLRKIAIDWANDWNSL